MIENNRRVLVDNGITYISIGVYVMIGVVVSYILGLNNMSHLMTPLWLSLMALLIVFNFIYKKKHENIKVRKTFASETFNAVWLSCSIPITAISVLYFIAGGIPIQILFVSISSILGIGYYLTGHINGLKFMKTLAFGWWLSTVAAMLWNYIGDESQLALFFAFLIFLFEVVPGIIIYKKWKRVYNE
jgi:phosphate/sulfate permease